jgi:ubiquinone/menaquinone biosynthesis C-methylase UbiE
MGDEKWDMYLLPEKIPEIFVDLYDSFAFKALGGYYLETAREIVSHCPKGRILDVGCGPGYLPLQIAKLSKDIRVDGVDLSPKMVTLARKNARKSCLENCLDFFVSDGNCLATSEERYDMVISTGVFHSLKNPVAFLNECHRVLKPGREAWVFDPAKLVSSNESVLQRNWKKGTKLLLYLGMALLIQILKPRPYSQKKVIEIVQRTHFSDYTISGENYVKIKFKK